MKGAVSMLDVKALKAEMVKNGYTQVSLSEAIGMSPRTFYTRLKTGDFGTKEIEGITAALKLQNPIEIFFAP